MHEIVFGCWYRIRYPAKHVSLRYLDLEYYYNVQLRYDFISTKYQASIQFTSKLIAKKIIFVKTQKPNSTVGSRLCFCRVL